MNASYEDQLQRCIEQYSESGIVLDTNVLLLLLVGQFRPSLIGGRRLEKYSVPDAQLLMAFVERFKRIFVTAHVLAETSNLAAQVAKGLARDQFFSALHPVFCGESEISLGLLSILGREVVLDKFVRLGLTDAALISVAGQGKLLLTDDLDLHLATVTSGWSSINFTHMREAAGLV